MNIDTLVHTFLPHALRILPTVEQEAAVLERVHQLLPPPPYDEAAIVTRLVQHIVDHDWLDIVLGTSHSAAPCYTTVFVH